MREFGEDQYFIFDDNPQTVRLRDLYDAHFSKARIPTRFMQDVLQRIKIFNEKKGSLIQFVEKRLQAEAKGSSK